MEQKSNTFLETAPLGSLMRKYSVPCIISLLVAALYNIVDQIFIANADYLGSFGNAANTAVFPLTVVALAIAVMIGDGCCAYVSISLGAGLKEAAHKSVGSAILLCILSSLVLTAVYLLSVVVPMYARPLEGTLPAEKCDPGLPMKLSLGVLCLAMLVMSFSAANVTEWLSHIL